MPTQIVEKVGKYEEQYYFSPTCLPTVVDNFKLGLQNELAKV